MNQSQAQVDLGLGGLVPLSGGQKEAALRMFTVEF